MSSDLVAILATAGVMVVGLLTILFGWTQRRSARSIVRGLGLMLLGAGLWAMGVMELITNGVRSLIDWANLQTLDTTIWVGIGLAGFGLLLYLIGGFITPVTRAAAKTARLAREEQTAPVGTGRPAPAARPTPAPKPAGSPDLTGNPDDDAGVERILKARGIQ